MRPLQPAVLAAAVLSLSGCAQTVAGTAIPEPRSTPVAVKLPANGAPPVDRPLSATELRRIEQDPCGTLTPAQLRTLDLATDETAFATTGPSCSWYNLATGSSASVIFPVKVVYQGLSQLYETHNRDQVEDYFFAMKPINGLPVLASAAVDSRDDGTCRVQIGLTNRKVVYLRVTISKNDIGVQEPCDKTHDVARLAVRNMKGSS